MNIINSPKQLQHPHFRKGVQEHIQLVCKAP